MAESGYIYVLINPSIEDLVKIGRTKRDPQERAAELSKATGVATPFYLAYKVYVIEMIRAEEFVHERLSEYRLTDRREFFRAPLDTAIETLIDARNLFGRDSEDDQEILNGSDGVQASESDMSETEYDELCAEIDEKSSQLLFHSGDRPHMILEGLELAEKGLRLNCVQLHTYCRILVYIGDNYLNGSSGFLQDVGESINYYKQAAKEGHKEAYLKLGELYEEGEFIKQDNEKALQYYWAGVKNGDESFWTKVASLQAIDETSKGSYSHLMSDSRIYSRFEEAFQQWNQSWQKYFASPYYIDVDPLEGCCGTPADNAQDYLTELDRWRCYGVLEEEVAHVLLEPVIDKARTDDDFRLELLEGSGVLGETLIQMRQMVVEKWDTDGNGYWNTAQKMLRSE